MSDPDYISGKWLVLALHKMRKPPSTRYYEGRNHALTAVQKLIEKEVERQESVSCYQERTGDRPPWRHFWD